MTLLQYIKMDLLEWKSIMFYIGAVLVSIGLSNIFKHPFIIALLILLGGFFILKSLK